MQPGDELRCPHCHRWHKLIQRQTEGTEYIKQMLYFQCGGQVYYGG
jgi:hypothetical protein